MRKVSKKVMYINDLAKYIGKSVRTAERWVEKGILPPANKSFGRPGFWLESEVDKWLNADYKKKCDRLLKNGTV